MFGKGIGTASQVVGDIVVGVEKEIGVDAAVDKFRHKFVELTRRTIIQSNEVGLGDLGSDMEMHMAFRLHDPCQDTVEVFVWLFLVMAILVGQIQFQSLQLVA